MTNEQLENLASYIRGHGHEAKVTNDKLFARSSDMIDYVELIPAYANVRDWLGY